jgi:hypothetical protein
VLNKKVLFTAMLAVAGYLGFRRYRSGKAEQDLWKEATDSVYPTDIK